MNKSDLAREVINRVNLTGASKSTIARILYKENPITFNNVETARSIVRYVTHSSGDELRDKQKNPIKMEGKKRNQYGWKLPEEQHNNYEPYVVPTSCKQLLVLSDVHIPYQDNKAVQVALDYGKDKEVDCIILNGDIIDCYQLSRWSKDPNKRDFKWERDATFEFLKSIREGFGPDTLIIYKEGNHEERFKKLLMAKAPEIYGFAEFQLDIILKLNELDIRWVDNKKIIKVGKLNMIHGHEYYGAYSPVNPAKAYYTKAGTNVMAGHNHQSSEHISKDMNDHVSGGWSLGCLCEMHPDYAPLNKWNHGFAHIKQYKDGSFKVYNKKIINGELL